MPTRPSSKKLDFSQIAVQVVEAATKSSLKPAKPPTPAKNPAAVALGRLGASKGGKARAKKLTKKKRIEIAQLAARTRWS